MRHQVYKRNGNLQRGYIYRNTNYHPNQALSIVSQYTREMLAHGYNVELMKTLYWVIMKVFTVTWGIICIVVLITRLLSNLYILTTVS